MFANTIFKKLALEDCQPNLLAEFDRRQEVKRCWRREDGQWRLQDIAFVEDWEQARKRRESQNIATCTRCGGAVIGAFLDGRLIGFSGVIHELFGTNKAYAQLDMLHVSLPFRNQGIGKQLFHMACDQARLLGAKKLYISSHSAEETQAFYQAVGCRDADEIDPKLYEKEPLDRHLEFIL